RRLERLARSLPGELGGCQLAQLLVDQRQEPIGGAGIALVDRFEDPRHVVHGWRPTGPILDAPGSIMTGPGAPRHRVDSGRSRRDSGRENSTIQITGQADLPEPLRSGPGSIPADGPTRPEGFLTALAPWGWIHCPTLG